MRPCDSRTLYGWAPRKPSLLSRARMWDAHRGRQHPPLGTHLDTGPMDVCIIQSGLLFCVCVWNSSLYSTQLAPPS